MKQSDQATFMAWLQSPQGEGHRRLHPELGAMTTYTAFVAGTDPALRAVVEIAFLETHSRLDIVELLEAAGGARKERIKDSGE